MSIARARHPVQGIETDGALSGSAACHFVHRVAGYFHMKDDGERRKISESFERALRRKVDLGDVREVRALMGADAEHLSDEEVMRIRGLGRDFANTVFHWWLRRRDPQLADEGAERDNSDDGMSPSSP